MKSTLLTSLPYEEPRVTTILIQSSLLLLLNVVNFALDKAVYCGLLGQVFLGVAWGTPGAGWLGSEVENAIVQLGYLGLLLVVYEGGLSTSFRSLKANLFLSLGVAATGICLPIGLSFILRHLTNATPLQCFAAGAALCSTSLGTTFTVLGTSGLTQSRLGVVLTSAAMMDDVIGLVMVQIISNLGEQSTSFNAAVVVRPLLVSVAFAVAAPLLCVLVALPVTNLLNRRREGKPTGYVNRILDLQETALIFHTLILVGYVAGASYAGTSNLFAAYIAGASISWWDSEVSHPTAHNEARAASTAVSTLGVTEQDTPAASAAEVDPDRPQNRAGVTSIPDNIEQNHRATGASGLHVYERFFAVPVNRLLRPFFFASIGFSIPISEMFSGKIVWKGLVYTMLMMLGKILCGAWLIRLSFRHAIPQRIKSRLRKMRRPKMHHFWGKREKKSTSAVSVQRPVSAIELSPGTQPAPTHTVSDAVQGSQSTEILAASHGHDSPAGSKPRSIYPASIMGCAMMARGEIGFLISSIAESKGVFASDAEEGSSSKLFLIVTWAIMLCTILGPLAVGLLVRRVKRLEMGVLHRGNPVRGDVLGVWGVGSR